MGQVDLKNVWKRYGDVVAVRDFNLSIADREFVVLVGPSGCGKSTTLRMVAGLEEITQGDLLIDGRKVNDVPPKDRDIAMVFQNYALYPHWTVFENMAFGLRLRKVPDEEIRRRVEETARILEIEPYLARKPKALSGGQRQRVAMGRAIVRNAGVFLFDEPLSNLDAKLRVQMRVEISRLHNRLKTTIIYVTHDQVEAMTLADRIVIMNNGEVQQIGSPLEVYHKPANRFVATFIGSPSMNIIPATWDSNTLKVAGHDLTPTAGQRNALAAAKVHEVSIGVRPQNVRYGHAAAGHDLLARVDVVEHLGSEAFVYLDLGGTPLTSRLEEGSEITEGSMSKFHLEMESVHLFGPDGRNLLAPEIQPAAMEVRS